MFIDFLLAHKFAHAAYYYIQYQPLFLAKARCKPMPLNFVVVMKLFVPCCDIPSTRFFCKSKNLAGS